MWFFSQFVSLPVCHLLSACLLSAVFRICLQTYRICGVRVWLNLLAGFLLPLPLPLPLPCLSLVSPCPARVDSARCSPAVSESAEAVKKRPRSKLVDGMGITPERKEGRKWGRNDGQSRGVKGFTTGTGPPDSRTSRPGQPAGSPWRPSCRLYRLPHSTFPDNGSSAYKIWCLKIFHCQSNNASILEYTHYHWSRPEQTLQTLQTLQTFQTLQTPLTLYRHHTLYFYYTAYYHYRHYHQFT